MAYCTMEPGKNEAYSSCGPPGTTESNYDVSIDGQRFLTMTDLDQDASSSRIVVLNFDEELKRKVDEAQKR